jgi:1-acyl-sn-glycerol-3-phosphate acyltransferase
MNGGPVRVASRAAMFLALTGLLLPFYLAGFALGRAARRRVAGWWFAGCRDIAGLRVRLTGRPATAAGTLYVVNHASYLDILVLGGLLDAAFVAKAEVSRWPLFGLLARLSGTEFISRRPSAARRVRDRLAERLDKGERLILFPEGTSSDNGRVLPFRSSFFDAARGERAVQPVTLAYVRDGSGRALDAEGRAAFAWFGAMELLPHLLGVFARDGVEVEIMFHPPVAAPMFPDRKALAAHCEAAVADGLAGLVAGRRRGEALWPGDRAAEAPGHFLYAIG